MKNTPAGVRKIIKLGMSSLAITLPPLFIEINHLQEGDEIAFIINGNTIKLEAIEYAKEVRVHAT